MILILIIIMKDGFDVLKIFGVTICFCAMVSISIPLGRKPERKLEIKIGDNGNYEDAATIQYQKHSPDSNLTDSLINK